MDERNPWIGSFALRLDGSGQLARVGMQCALDALAIICAVGPVDENEARYQATVLF
jgi:hypothetical protein